MTYIEQVSFGLEAVNSGLSHLSQLYRLYRLYRLYPL
jgi:hypothetical protein